MWKDFLNVAKAAGDNLRFFFTVQPLATTLIRESVSGGVTTTTTQQKGSVSGVYGGGYFAGVFGGFA
jgi:alpha-D-ribose 1-methylphosphonate 5-triphosphate synthase subunit PhnI